MILIAVVVKLLTSKQSQIVKIIGSVALVVIMLSLVFMVVNWKIPQGRIISPQDGDSVSRAFAVEGSTRNIPSNKHLWVVVQISNRS